MSGLVLGSVCGKLENSAPVTSDTDGKAGCETEFTLPGLMEFRTWNLREGSFDPFSPMLGSVAGVTVMTMIALALPPSPPPRGSLTIGEDRSIPRQ